MQPYQYTLQLFAVKDEKTQLFTHPNFVTDEIAASRGISIVSNDPNSQLNHFPADFSFWSLGTLNLSTGLFESKIDFVNSITTLKNSLPPKTKT